ncbi:hypothetical protein K466DRAFT_61805 [Polyporus arcularius HHB13444]|uniref:Uncharacterized protein n=1 Tax=Polyporus arcularius HHB13444 TaxID=1314778 RepID=A0A5C3NNX2_9APHY|nr:hypothetical protein K466DRAFT_61805 [Polyporus arcularius HHB13444]
MTTTRDLRRCTYCFCCYALTSLGCERRGSMRVCWARAGTGTGVSYCIHGRVLPVDSLALSSLDQLDTECCGRLYSTGTSSFSSSTYGPGTPYSLLSASSTE